MTIVTTARVPCASKDSRQKALVAFRKIVEYSQANEPGVLRYIVTLPVDDPNEKDIYMVEEYADQAALDAHLNAPPVVDLIALFGQPGVLAGVPDVYNLTPSIDFARPELRSLSLEKKPAMVMASFGFKASTLSHAVEGWRELIAYSEQNEPQTWGYTVMGDNQSNTLRTVEAYESWEFVKGVHLKSPAIKVNTEHNGNDRTGEMSVVELKAVDGFFGRP